MTHCDQCPNNEGCTTNNSCYFTQWSSREKILENDSLPVLLKKLEEYKSTEEYEMCAVIKRVIDKKKNGK